MTLAPYEVWDPALWQTDLRTPQASPLGHPCVFTILKLAYSPRPGFRSNWLE
jgi:hypothetical protein